MPKQSSGVKKARDKTSRTVRLRPANPFDLIRLIAESQNDPRKAVAELVQNSLDAGARRITLTRASRKKEQVLSILDDGQGIFPGVERAEALERIATNVGHSFKRNLSPAERKKEMLLGKYGIGLLGFWSVGQVLEIRTRSAGSDTWALRLTRGQPVAEVYRLPQKMIQFPGETWTEVVIRGVHSSAARQIAGRKLGDYIGSELRGQLLERSVDLRIVDRVARGTAIKDFLVVPQRYRGRRLEDFVELPVPGFGPARLELYLVDPEEAREKPSVALTCGGTVVAEDISQLESHDFARAPWTIGALDGAIEFGELEVAPATRRGVVPGPAADGFFEALRALEPEILKVLDTEKERRLSEETQDLAREIRKVFRPVARSLPQYDFFAIRGESRSDHEPADGDGARLGHAGSDSGKAASGGEEPSGPADGGDLPDEEPEILPPGPLSSVKVAPAKAVLLPGASRVFSAKPMDADGRRVVDGVELAWSLVEGGGTLTPAGARAEYGAPPALGAARITVEARQDGREASAEAVVQVVDRLAGENPDAGVPEPERVYDPSGDWRSRLAGGRWQYNAAHPDYAAVMEEPRRRLRYLVHLFAKEMVLWNYGEPKDERLLERMVEVLTCVQA